VKKTKRKLNLSPERRAQLAAAMKARWAAKRAAEGNSATSTDQNSPTPPTQSRGKQRRRRSNHNSHVRSAFSRNLLENRTSRGGVRHWIEHCKRRRGVEFGGLSSQVAATMNFHLFDLAGFIGVVLIIVAYLLLQLEKLPSSSPGIHY
jgi:hypothetical protein